MKSLKKFNFLMSIKVSYDFKNFLIYFLIFLSLFWTSIIQIILIWNVDNDYIIKMVKLYSNKFTRYNIIKISSTILFLSSAFLNLFLIYRHINFYLNKILKEDTRIVIFLSILFWFIYLIQPNVLELSLTIALLYTSFAIFSIVLKYYKIKKEQKQKT
jgi:hypothetical protein